jgi:hypothetical protein
MDNIRIIRFKNGESIITFVEELNDESKIRIINPFTYWFNYDTDDKTKEMQIFPWLDLELTEDCFVDINLNDILFSTEANDTFIDAYIAILDDYYKDVDLSVPIVTSNDKEKVNLLLEENENFAGVIH